MIEKLFNKRVRKFIDENEFADPFSLALKYKEIDGADISIIIDQIKGRAIAKKKLPLWHSKTDVVYPPKISLEQCSSQETGLYKASLVSGKTIVDLTGGAGVDLYFLSQNFDKAFYIERNYDLLQVSEHNFSVLKADNVQCFNSTSETFLSNFSKEADVIYLDPARRATSGKKVFQLEDCEPNVIEMLPMLLSKGKKVLIKTSPMLDVSSGLKNLRNVKEVHIVSVENECKELLYLISDKAEGPNIKTVNIKRNGQNQCFNFMLENEAEAHLNVFSKPLNYLYEPNASILKSGAFKLISQHFDVMKLHPNTHLYTSKTLVDNFPGRTFEIKEITKYNKKEIAKALPDKKANIAARNFPEEVSQIRKRMKISDGGEIYLFACTGFENEKMIIITKKL
ncbi:MAG: class I SAM-dependent methyltransferase [Bacteroidota bacterium]